MTFMTFKEFLYNLILEPGEAVYGGCKPDPTPIELDLPQKIGTTYIPTCARVNKCGGCCFGDVLSCQPTKTKTIYIDVCALIVLLLVQ